MMTFLTKRNQHTTKPGNLVKWSNISMLLSKMLWCCKYNLWKSFEERMKNARVITQWTVNEAKPNQQWLQALVSHWFKNRIPLSFWCWKDDSITRVGTFRKCWMKITASLKDSYCRIYFDNFTLLPNSGLQIERNIYSCRIVNEHRPGFQKIQSQQKIWKSRYYDGMSVFKWSDNK